VTRRLLTRAFAGAFSLLLLAGCAAQAPLELVVIKSSGVLADKPDWREEPSLAVLQARVDETQPGCSAAVAVHGEIVWAGASGLAEMGTGEALTTATRFDIASLSKQFTATAILLLQREGLVSLSDPIGLYVDGLPAWGQSITLDQLMHHTSHIPDYWRKLGTWGFGFGTPATQADAVRAIAAVPTLDRGTGYLYSNSNYILLAEVVHRVSGEPLPDFLADRIFTRLNLDMKLDPGLQDSVVAISYDDNNQPTRSGWAFYVAVGIVTTPTELALWGDQYRQGAIIGDDFALGAVDNGKPGEATEGRRYAAGINIEPGGALRHDGRIGGYITTFKVSPDRETTLVVMCNGHLADRFGVVDGLWQIWVRPSGD
jgi:CubicO group peptidase (beta-lactamase class C family)